jgi:thiamine-phosphate pyrophosphorylase
MAPPAERIMVIVERPAEAEAALASAPAGTVLVQLRDKQAGGRELYDRAVALRALAARAGARVVVNDRVDVALAAGLDGVHLPEDGMDVADARRLLGPRRLVGASTHAVARAAAQAAAGADLVTIGPVWDTPSKRAYGTPLGLDVVRGAASLPVRVFALGGVDSPERAAQAVAAGAWGIAVIRAAPQAGALLAAMQRGGAR